MTYRLKWIKNTFGSTIDPLTQRPYTELDCYYDGGYRTLNRAYQQREEALEMWPLGDLIVEEETI